MRTGDDRGRPGAGSRRREGVHLDEPVTAADHLKIADRPGPRRVYRPQYACRPLNQSDPE
jgi:hypothetical protein